MKGTNEQARRSTCRLACSGLGYHRHGPSILGILVGLAVFAGITGCQAPAAGQNDVRRVDITDIEGYVELMTRQRERDRVSKVGGRDQNTKEAIFEEDLQLETDGYVYHPNLLEFTLAGLFGLVQHRFEDNYAGRAESVSDSGTALEFDVNGHYFKEKKYPGWMYARRYRRFEPRPFQSSLEATTENYGLTWQHLDEKMPTTVQFDHIKVDLDPLSQDENRFWLGGQQVTTFRYDTEYRFSQDNVLSLLYDRKSVKEEPFGFNYDSDEVTLSHRLDFGDQRQHKLESELNYIDQTGSFNIERARLRETLRLQHTANLRSIFNAELTDRTQGSQNTVDPLGERFYYISGMLEHRLYESLISQLRAFAQTQRFESGSEIDRFGSRIRFDYRKKNPLGGLQADYQVYLHREDRRAGDQNLEFIDQRRTLQDPEPTILQEANIQTSSIRITNLDRTHLYQVGRDYTLDAFADRVEIRRVPTGQTADGEAVLVSYVANLGGSFQLDTLGQDLGIRHNFEFGLSPYYRLRWQDQTVSPQTSDSVIAEDITAHIIGAEYRRKQLRLNAEYENYDSALRPFNALRLSGSFRHRFESGASGTVQARWTDISRDPPNARDTTLFTVEALYRHPITHSLTVEGSALYRSEEDSVSGNNDGLDLDFSLEWFIRKTELRITAEYGQFETDFAKNENSALYVQLRRRF